MIKLKVSKLEKYMKDNNLSIRSLAKELNVDHTSISRLIRNETNPGVKIIDKILLNTDFDFYDIFEVVED